MKLSEIAKTELLRHKGISIFEWLEYNHLEMEIEETKPGKFAAFLKRKEALVELRDGGILAIPTGFSSYILPDKYQNLSGLNRAIRSLADQIEGRELMVSLFKQQMVEMLHVPPKLSTPWLKMR